MRLVEAIDLVLHKLRVWEEQAILFLPNLAVAVLVVVASWVAARIGRNVVRTVLSRDERDALPACEERRHPVAQARA